MTIKLATADYSFPLLEWRQALRLARDLGMSGIDISLFEGRSQLDLAVALSHPSFEGSRVRETARENGLAIADVFGISEQNFEASAPNHPDPIVRRASRDFFLRLLEFAVSCESSHLTVLPGVALDHEPFSSSLARSGEELAWRLDAASSAGVALAFEAHLGSVAANPAYAHALLQAVPGLTITLDPAHFIAQGYAQNVLSPLIPHASHLHMRCACPGRLQAALRQNTIDFQAIVSALAAQDYQGWYAIEYVWIDWEHCNEVDNVSETILLRNLLNQAAQALE